MNPLRWRNSRVLAFALVVFLLWLLFFLLSDVGQSTTGNSLPSWIETFPLSYEPFSAQTLPIVVFSSYRYDYLIQSVGALIKVAEAGDIDPSTSCTFVFHKTSVTKSENVQKSLEYIKSVRFCKVKIWEYDDHLQHPSAALYKAVWWKVMRRVFPKGVVYRGDVFFLEEDAIVSPDVMKVLWFCSRVKNTFGPDIHAVALGGFSGSNHVNPHPDTVIVRKTVFFQAMGYLFNATFWDYIEPHQKALSTLDDAGDFSEEISYYMGSFFVNRPLHFVTPTLSRMWHIGKKGLGFWGNYSDERVIEEKPSWEKSHRLMNIEKPSVSDGIRDVFGFLCEPKDRLFYRTARDNLCKQTMCNYAGKYFDINCMRQPFVTDKCIKTEFLTQEKCYSENFFSNQADNFRYKFMRQW